MGLLGSEVMVWGLTLFLEEPAQGTREAPYCAVGE